jgi:hypothetical protein
VLLFDARGARKLVLATATDGPVGLHVANARGESFLVPDVLALGPASGLSADARARVVALAEGEGVVAHDTQAAAATAPVAAAAPLVTRFTGIHPNPFFGATTIAYDLAQPARVRIALYSPAGRALRVLEDGTAAAGPHRLTWDGRDGDGRRLAPGIYLVRFEGDGIRANAKAILLP